MTREVFFGKALNFFPDAEFETVAAQANQAQHRRIMARNVLRLMMMGWRDDWRRILSYELFNMTYLWTDPLILRAMRDAFQSGFEHIYTEVHEREMSEIDLEQAQIFISNCLCYLPKADLNPFESYKIPQYLDNQWRMVDYKVVPIELTAQTGLAKIFIEEADRVFAYGLEPLTELNARPHLIFLGTTHPAGQGFAAQIHTDLQGFETAGHMLYCSGRDRILAWIEQQQVKPHVCGISLGGALGLLLAIDVGDKLWRVDALNPAGLYNAWYKSALDHWQEQVNEGHAPEVVIQRQGKDPISRFGIYKPEWTLLQVDAPMNKRAHNAAVEHALNYAGLEGTRFIPIDIVKDNKARQLSNFWIYGLLRGFVYYTVLAPYFYVIRPLAGFFLKHPFLTILAAIGVSFNLLFAPMGLPWLLIVCAAPLAISFGLSLVKAAITILGFNKIEALDAHNETHRNLYVRQDLYEQSNEAEFKLSELKHYYKAKQLIKEGALTVAIDVPHKTQSFRFFQNNQAVSKADLLEQIKQDANFDEVSEDTIVVKGSSAKLNLMKHMANDFKLFGDSATPQLALRYEHYKENCLIKN